MTPITANFMTETWIKDKRYNPPREVASVLELFDRNALWDPIWPQFTEKKEQYKSQFKQVAGERIEPKEWWELAGKPGVFDEEPIGARKHPKADYSIIPERLIFEAENWE